MGCFVYILYSPGHNRTYVGQTENLNNRLKYHNSGKVRSTKAYLPWKMIYNEELADRSQAIRREKWFKSSQGRKLLMEIVREYHFRNTEAETNGLSA